MRIEGWESLLNEHIEQAKGIVFEWGMNDCALWAADWVNKATGNDFASQWRGLYTTEAELNALMAERELELPGDIADDVGLPQMDVPFAQRGDIVLVRQGRRKALAGCVGAEIAAPSKAGLESLPISVAINAWRI